MFDALEVSLQVNTQRGELSGRKSQMCLLASVCPFYYQQAFDRLRPMG